MDPTSPSGGDQTDLLSGGGTTLDSGSLSNMLVVTTTMRMLHRVHGNTTHLWPAVPLHSVLVEGSAGLEDRLVDPSTSSNTSNHGTVGRGDNLLRAGGQLHPGLLGVRVVGDDGGVVAGGPGELAAITSLFLKVAHDGSLGHVADGHHVADGKVGLLAAVHELSSVHALSSDEELLLHLVSVRIPEVGHGKGSATAWVVNDFLDVAMPLGEVDSPESRLALPVLRVRHEDRSRALPLGSDDATHLSCRSESSNKSL